MMVAHQRTIWQRDVWGSRESQESLQSPRYLTMTSFKTQGQSTRVGTQRSRQLVGTIPENAKSRLIRGCEFLKVAITSGGPGTTGISMVPPASAQNSLQ